MRNGVMLHVGAEKGDIFHSCDSDGCYRFIKVFMCLLLRFVFDFVYMLEYFEIITYYLVGLCNSVGFYCNITYIPLCTLPFIASCQKELSLGCSR
jgi:hypothetical protein